MQLHVQFRLLGSTRGTDGFTLCFPSSIGPPPLADIQICCFHSFSDRVLCSHPCAIAVSSPPVSPRCMPHPVLARLSPIVCLSPFRRMTGTAGGGFWQPNGPTVDHMALLGVKGIRVWGNMGQRLSCFVGGQVRIVASEVCMHIVTYRIPLDLVDRKHTALFFRTLFCFFNVPCLECNCSRGT